MTKEVYLLSIWQEGDEATPVRVFQEKPTFYNLCHKVSSYLDYDEDDEDFNASKLEEAVGKLLEKDITTTKSCFEAVNPYLCIILTLIEME